MLSALFALTFFLAVKADVTPDEPGPGAVFKEGGQCRIHWKGDTASTTAWSNMSIKLRSGANQDMKDITVVATGQDGTKDGTYEYPCPDVTPQSAIYFYEFTAPGAPDATWTTRFLITDASGASTPPANDKQPNGDPIPWGVGSLQSGQASSAPAGLPSISGASSPGALASSASASSMPASTPSGMTTARPPTGATKAAAATAGTAGAAAATSSVPNGASSLFGETSSRVWSVALVLASSALGFTVMF